jgi:hypothetical protein
MDQPWLSIFDNSMHQPWLNFCYRFDASVVISLTLSIPCGSCHSVFIDDFKVYSDSVFADDLWKSSDIAFFTIPCISHDSIFPIDLKRRSWIHWRCQFHAVVSLRIHWRFQGLLLLCFGLRFMDQPWHSVFDNAMRRPWLYFCYRFDTLIMNSWMLSIPCGSCHSVFIDDFKVYCHSVFIKDFKVYSYSILAGDLWIALDIAFLTIPCVDHDSIFAIDLMRRSWILSRCRFHAVAVTQYSLTISRSTLLSYCRRYMDQPWQSVFYNSMRRPWLYFCYQFDASVVNSVTLSIPCCTCHSVFIDDFKVYGYSVLAADLCISRDIAFLTIPCVGHDSIFAFHLMRRSWIHWRCWFHAVPVTQYSLTISRSTVTLFWPPIYVSAVT